MNRISALLVAGVVLFGLASAQARGLPDVRMRGVITAFDGQTLQVDTREGRKLTVGIGSDTRISMLYPRKLRDIKPGSFVGITAIQTDPSLPLLAREVHIFAESQRGSGEGHYGWDLEPGSSMTNAYVDAIVNGNDGKVLTLSYKGGSQQIAVPRGTPIVSFKLADSSILKKGVQIFCIAKQSAGGGLTARHILAGKNGMKPPM